VCQACGTSFTAQAPTQKWNAQTIAPWVAIGLATVALIISFISWFDRGSDAVPRAAAPFSQSAPAAFSAPGQPPDLANMTPREAADRLFNRVMAASERGDSKEALEFAPMALQAYDALGTLDNDARYHVALIHLTAGESSKARAQIESIRKSVPGHLLATILEHEVAERGGNKSAAAQSYKKFLANYDAEIVSGRGEYRDHQGTIDRFRQAAQASTAGKK
jgi:hypothetical protein